MIITIATEEEVFKFVTYPGIEPNRYLISNYGKVYDIKYKKFKKQSSGINKYKRTYMAKIHGPSRSVSVHRLVAWEFVSGFSEERNIVNHLDSNRTNNYAGNLEWCNHSENNFHSVEHGERPKGEKVHTNVYSKSLIISICKLMEEGYNNTEIRNILGLYELTHVRLLTDIRRRKTWKYISKNYNF